MKGSLNSQPSVMLGLQSALLIDCTCLTDYPPLEARRDTKTLEHRLSHEGPSFFCKTLPLLPKALDSALLSGTFLCPTSFKRKKGTKLPCLFYGLFRRIFF